MLTKEKIISAIQDLPDDFSIDDVLDKLMLIRKIEIGVDQSNQGKVIPDEELDKVLPSWLV